MLIVWIRRNKAKNQVDAPKRDEASFRQHSEEMKRFALSHPKLESPFPHDIMTPEGHLLAAIDEVRLTVHCQN